MAVCLVVTVCALPQLAPSANTSELFDDLICTSGMRVRGQGNADRACVSAPGVVRSEEGFLVNSGSERPQRVDGSYALVPNPCTSEPCLPGMVYAVVTDRTTYFLTTAGQWLFENHSWEGFLPEPGTQVTVQGDVTFHRDLRGDAYQNLEVLSLKPAD